MEEISNSLDKSERTVRRLLSEAKQKIEQRLLADESSVPITRPLVVVPQAKLHFSDYVLEQLLGTGGMGKVFRAIEKTTGKKVAVKTLHKSRLSDERAVSQFAQEAQILAKLRHPNIVGVQGLGRFPGGGYFIVMDFVDGIDLQSRLEEGPLPLDGVVSIVREVAHAIGYAHDKGIVHCDLKPGNILCGKNGQISVTDFGFAFLIVGNSQFAANYIGGTTGYLAPEILHLQSLPTPAADIYALGVLIWTLATASMPDESTALRIQDKSFAPLVMIVERCLEIDPTSRYQNAGELIKELDALI